MKTPLPQALPAGAFAGETARADSIVSDLMVLTKARLSTLVLVTTLIGFLLASSRDEGVAWMLLLQTLFGTGLVAAGASVLNQALEKIPDQKMSRTRNRPVAAGRLSPGRASLLGIGLSALGLLVLAATAGEPAAGLAGLTLVVYVLFYTPAKRRTSLCTLIGAVSGAIPPVIGWFAAGGGAAAGGWFLFAVLFFWQLPHFLSINWVYRGEYERAGFVMWSNGDENGKRTAVLSIGFILALLAVSAWGFVAGFLGPVYLAGALILGAGFLWLGVRFLRDSTVARARGLFFYSLFYLPTLLGLMLCGRTN